MAQQLKGNTVLRFLELDENGIGIFDSNYRKCGSHDQECLLTELSYLCRPGLSNGAR
jgi:hypothetical protein